MAVDSKTNLAYNFGLHVLKVNMSKITFLSKSEQKVESVDYMYISKQILFYEIKNFRALMDLRLWPSMRSANAKISGNKNISHVYIYLLI